MKFTVSSLLLIFATLPSQLSAESPQDKSDQQQLLGTWKLISYVRREIPSGATSDVMGPHPSGYINWGPDGRVIVIIAGSDRKKPAGSVATPVEAEALFKSLVSYAGTYTIDTQAKTVTHHVDISWNETYTGTDQVRHYVFQGSRLSIDTIPSPDPFTGKMTVRSLIWERSK